jgi:hypothetical protein
LLALRPLANYIWRNVYHMVHEIFPSKQKKICAPLERPLLGVGGPAQHIANMALARRLVTYRYFAISLVYLLHLNQFSKIHRAFEKHGNCYGAWAMGMIGCAGLPTPRKIRMYHTVVAAPAFLATSSIGPSVYGAEIYP